MRLIIAGERSCGKTTMLDALARRLRDADIPVLLLKGSNWVASESCDVIGELAKVCGFNRVRIEQSVLLIDDVDRLLPVPGKPGSGLYFGLVPFFEGRNEAYGRYLDQVRLANVDIIATASWQDNRGGMLQLQHGASRKVILPELVAGCCQIMDIDDLQSPAQGHDVAIPARKESGHDCKER